MEQNTDKLNDEWVSWLGDDAYIVLTDAIKEVINQVSALCDDPVLLSVIEGGLVGICDTSLTKDAFWGNVMSELTFTSTSDKEKGEIVNILKDFVNSFGFNQSIYKSEPNIATETKQPSDNLKKDIKIESLKQLEKNLSSPTNLAPVKREYTSKPADPTSSTDAPKTQSIDPYREIPEK